MTVFSLPPTGRDPHLPFLSQHCTHGPGSCPLTCRTSWKVSPADWMPVAEVPSWLHLLPRSLGLGLLCPKRGLFPAFWCGPLPTRAAGSRPWRGCHSALWAPQALPRLLAVSCHPNWLLGKSVGGCGWGWGGWRMAARPGLGAEGQCGPLALSLSRYSMGAFGFTRMLSGWGAAASDNDGEF